MGKFQICTQFHAFTVTPSPVVNPLAPATRLAQRERPLREMLTVNLSEQTLTCDLGSAQLWKVIHLLRGNFPLVTLTDGDSLGSLAPIPAVPSALALDRADTFYKLTYVADRTKRYLRAVIPNQATTDGFAAYSLATILLGKNLITLPRSPLLGMSGGREEPAEIDESKAFFFAQEAGAPARTLEWRFRVRTEDAGPIWDLINLGMWTPFLAIRNRGVHQEAYYLTRCGPHQDQDYGKFHVDFAFPVRQVQ